mgnify:CR=1 FL=1
MKRAALYARSMASAVSSDPRPTRSVDLVKPLMAAWTGLVLVFLFPMLALWLPKAIGW